MFKVTGSGSPTRLIVGGLHGNEGGVTGKILDELFRYGPEKGKSVLCNLSERGRYVSTLDPSYYKTGNGIRLLSLIREFRPEIYAELHSYNARNYSRLTDPHRTFRVGVPPLIDLESRVLIGSISPCIRTTEFDEEDFCISVETPSDLGGINVTINLLSMILNSDDGHEVLDQLRARYPEKIRKAEEYFHLLYKNLNPF